MKPLTPAQRAVRMHKPPPHPLAGLVDPRLEGAACAGHAPMFDAEVDGESPLDRLHRHAMAARVCDRCPVRAACATAAAEQDQPSGVWAGLVHNAPGMPGRPRTQETA